MKTITGLSLSLLLTAGLVGCTATGNNANLRNTNTNTGYLSNNANMMSSTPAPAAQPMSSPMTDSNMKPGMTNSNMKPGMTNSNMNMKPTMNSNSKMVNKPIS